VTVIVLGFVGFILLWTLSICIFGCLYRYLYERRLDPEGYRARTETQGIRRHQEKEDEEFMEEVLRREQDRNKLH
jgi:hypothetical protein